MKFLKILTAIGFVLTFTLTIGYCLEDFSVETLIRIKRKGGRGGGGRGSSSRGSSSRSKVPSNSYPKQPAYPNQNSAPYPKQPAYNPNFNPGQQAGGAHYPGQTGGAHYPGQGSQSYPGQTGFQPNYGSKSSSGSGLGKTLGAGALGGLGGAALGAYGGYKLGRAVGSMGQYGHYGYFDNHHGQQVYVKCDPPPKIETDPTTNVTYIPKTVTYDARCHYYDQDHSQRYPTRRYGYMNAGLMSMPSNLTTILTITLVLMFGFNNEINLKF